MIEGRKPICPHCGAEMLKVAIQNHDCSGWIVGWTCNCEPDQEDIELTIHSDKDWMAEVLYGGESD